MTVHTFLQKYCIADCAWLLPFSASLPRNSEQRPNELEMAKRRELLQEFIFWIVDGLVIPLVRVSLSTSSAPSRVDLFLKTAFYITDSAIHQNRPLFFRQDDWDRLCAPLLGTLGKTIFERIPAVSRSAQWPTCFADLCVCRSTPTMYYGVDNSASPMCACSRRRLACDPS